MKNYGECTCICISCRRCPLLIFGCGSCKTTVTDITSEDKWDMEMTLQEILDARIAAMDPVIDKNSLARFCFENAVAAARIALLAPITVGELEDD